jgi:hypothetical protein
MAYPSLFAIKDGMKVFYSNFDNVFQISGNNLAVTEMHYFGIVKCTISLPQNAPFWYTIMHYFGQPTIMFHNVPQFATITVNNI